MKPIIKDGYVSTTKSGNLLRKHLRLLSDGTRFPTVWNDRKQAINPLKVRVTLEPLGK